MNEKYLVEFYDFVDNFEKGSVMIEQAYFKKAYSSDSTLADLLINFKTLTENIYSVIKIPTSKYLQRLQFTFKIQDTDESSLSSNSKKDNFFRPDLNTVVEFHYYLGELSIPETIISFESWFIEKLWEEESKIFKIFDTNEIAIDCFLNSVDSKLGINLCNFSDTGDVLFLEFNVGNNMSATISKLVSMANEFENIFF